MLPQVLDGRTALQAEQALLRVAGVSRAFGGVHALDNVTLEVHEGELLGIIGPNGAGKSTLFKVVSGFLRPDRGQVWFAGRPVAHLPAYRRATTGIAFCFQDVRLFPTMTALENVMVGCHPRTQHGFVDAVLRLPRHHREERWTRERAQRLLTRVGLATHAQRPAGFLPFGVQRTLAIARALATGPRLLLLDEPAAGLTAAERARLADLLADIRRDGVTVVLIEHDVALVMVLADRVAVLENGRLIAVGPPEQVQADSRVIAAYLGDESLAEA